MMSLSAKYHPQHLPTHFKIVNATLWSSQRAPRLVTLHMERGKVIQIEEQPAILEPHEPCHATVDLKGQALLPTGVDLQVHLRVPGQPEKESPESGLRAALRGGVGALLTMPNTKPVLDNPESIALARRELSEALAHYPVEVWFSAAITKGQQGLELVDGEALKKAGVVAFTDDGVGVMKDELMNAAFALSAKSDLPLLQHAEMPGHGAALAPGPTQKKLGLTPYPPEAEWKMVERDLALLKAHPQARYHILHISSRKTLELLAQAKNDGLKVTGEVTPHHLWLNSAHIVEGQTNYKMNPPLREEADRVALVQALQSGLVDFVSTDHAPHEKERKGSDFRAAAFGTTGLETSLRVLLGLWQKGELSSERLVQVWTTEAAKFIGKANDFSDIKEGAELKAVWVDAHKVPTAVELHNLESLSKNNCFVGHKLPGEILGVFHGERVFRF